MKNSSSSDNTHPSDHGAAIGSSAGAGLRKSLMDGLNAIQIFSSGHGSTCNEDNDGPCDCGYVDPLGIVDALIEQIERDWPLGAAAPGSPSSPGHGWQKDAAEIRSSWGFLLMRLAVAADLDDVYAVCKKEFQEHEPAAQRLETSLPVYGSAEWHALPASPVPVEGQ